MESITINDNDPSILYTGHWKEGLNDTANGTPIPGDRATYVFNGSSISVFGTISPGIGRGATSHYIIDKSPPESIYEAQPRDDITLTDQQLYKSHPLDPSKEHTLVITLLKTGQNALWIDYFKVETQVPPTTIPSSSISTPPAATTASPPFTQPPITSQTEPADPNTGGISRNAVVGIAVGSTVGVLLIATIAILLFCFIRRRNKRKDEGASTQRVNAFNGRSTIEYRNIPSSHTPELVYPQVYPRQNGYVVHGGLSIEKNGSNNLAPSRERDESGAGATPDILPTYTSIAGNQ